MTAVTEATEESTSKFVQTSRWRLHYNEMGTGNPVIMIHGGGPGSSGWNNFVRNAPVFAQKFRVLMLDLPGFGQSDALDPTVEGRDYSLALQLFMDELGVDRASFIGNSLGGNVSLQYTVDHTDRVSHVVAMGSGYGDVEIFTNAGHVRANVVMREAFAAPTPENFRRLIDAMTWDSSFITEEMLRGEIGPRPIAAGPPGELNQATDRARRRRLLKPDPVAAGQYDAGAPITGARTRPRPWRRACVCWPLCRMRGRT